MVLLIDLEDRRDTSTIGLFGVQYTKVTAEKQTTMSTILKLLEASAGHVDCVYDEQHKDTGSSASCSTTIFIAYVGDIFGVPFFVLWSRETGFLSRKMYFGLLRDFVTPGTCLMSPVLA